MHFYCKCSKKRAPGTTKKRNSLYKNQHVQSHFPSIKMGPVKHRTKLGLYHIQLWEFKQPLPVPSQLSPEPPWFENVKRVCNHFLCSRQMIANVSFTSARGPSTSGFPICLWLEPVMKNCGCFCLLLLYIWNCNFMGTNAFSRKAEILNSCVCWTR